MGDAETPIAIIAFVRLGPKKAANAIAKIKNGQAKKASVAREIRVSTIPPKKPANMPIVMPSTSEIATETVPANNEARAPQTTRASTSRPSSSVPNQCAPVGALRMAAQLASIGS